MAGRVQSVEPAWASTTTTIEGGRGEHLCGSREEAEMEDTLRLSGIGRREGLKLKPRGRDAHEVGMLLVGFCRNEDYGLMVRRWGNVMGSNIGQGEEEFWELLISLFCLYMDILVWWMSKGMREIEIRLGLKYLCKWIWMKIEWTRSN